MKTNSLIVTASILLAMSVSASQDIAEGASQHLAKGEQLIEQHTFPEAIAALKTGIDQLGNSYVNPAVIDDTGQKLTLAQISEQQGKLQQAAFLYRGVLRSRLDANARKK